MNRYENEDLKAELASLTLDCARTLIRCLPTLTMIAAMTYFMHGILDEPYSISCQSVPMIKARPVKTRKPASDEASRFLPEASPTSPPPIVKMAPVEID